MLLLLEELAMQDGSNISHAKSSTKVKEYTP
jgi:hypothetical protein